MTRRVIPALCLSTLLSTGCAWADDELPSQEPPPDLRHLVRLFKSDVLPKLHLEGKAARTAIEDLGQLGFACMLVPEQEDLYSSKPLQPYVVCNRLMTMEDGKIYGDLRVHVFMRGWKGDSTSPAGRYEQLMTAEVDQTLVASLLYTDARDSKAAKKQSSLLDRTLVIATPNQPMSEVVKYAMTHEILCRATIESVDHRAALECSTIRPSPRCGHALISIAVSEGERSSQPLSIWSTDRVVEGKQGPWTCLHASR